MLIRGQKSNSLLENHRILHCCFGLSRRQNQNREGGERNATVPHVAPLVLLLVPGFICSIECIFHHPLPLIYFCFLFLSSFFLLFSIFLLTFLFSVPHLSSFTVNLVRIILLHKAPRALLYLLHSSKLESQL